MSCQDTEARRQSRNFLFRNGKWNGNGIDVQKHDECITAVLAGIHDDDRSISSCPWEVGKQKGRRNRERPGNLRTLDTTFCDGTLDYADLDPNSECCKRPRCDDIVDGEWR